jgi:hypothetical protein
MITTEELRLAIKADVAAAVENLKKYDRQTKSTQTATSKMKQTFADMRDVMQGPIAAYNAITGAVKKIGAEIDKYIMSAVESEKATSNLMSVLRATNGVAGMTSSELSKLSEEVARLTLFEHEDVTQAEALLLTYKNISKKVFPDAIKAAADLATIMGVDLSSATKTLGKALADPIAAAGMLKKSGIVLSAAQKEQIKSFMDVNDVAAAQKVILDSLNSSMGGTAEAAAKTATGAYLNMKKAMGEVNESLGKNIAYTFNGIIKNYSDGLNKIASWWDSQTKQSKVVGLLEPLLSKKTNITELEKSLSSMGLTWADAIDVLTEKYQKMDKQRKNTGTDYYDNEINSTLSLLSFARERASLEASTLKKREKAAKEAELAEQRLEERKKKKQLLGQQEADRLDDITAGETETFRQMVADEKALTDELNKYRLDAAMATADELDAITSGETETYRQMLKNKTDAESASDAVILEGKKILAEQTISGVSAMATALIDSLAAGEDGWKAFGKAGLNAIAGVMEAFAAQYAAMAVAELVDPLTMPKGIGHAAAAVGLYASAAIVRAIPMAEGGSGVVTKPTLFLAGEAGPEPFAFGGANNKRGMGGTINHFQFNGSPFAIKDAEAVVYSAISKANRGY